MRKIAAISCTFLTLISTFANAASTGSSCTVLKKIPLKVSLDEKLPGNTAILTRFSNGVIHFRANMDVNTDGAPNSYHPDDKGASNILCNGINIEVPDNWRGDNKLVEFERSKPHKSPLIVNGVGAKGNLTGKETCRLFMQLYREAKQSQWQKSNSIPYVRWPAIATEPKRQADGQMRDVPCIQKPSDPAPGFFVSTTRFEDKSKATCDVSRYLDATRISNIVIPDIKALSDADIQVGSAAIVSRNGTTIATFVGDSGPRNRLGEGSIKLARRLTDQESSLSNVAYPVDYFIFPGKLITSAPNDAAVEAKVKNANLNIAECMEALKQSQ